MPLESAQRLCPYKFVICHKLLSVGIQVFNHPGSRPGFNTKHVGQFHKCSQAQIFFPPSLATIVCNRFPTSCIRSIVFIQLRFSE